MVPRALLMLSAAMGIACGPAVSTPKGAHADGTSDGAGSSTGGSDSWSDSSSDSGSLGDWDWSPECIVGLEAGPADAEQAAQLLFRLLDEARHHTQRVQERVAVSDGLGTDPHAYNDPITFFSGSLRATGSITIEPFGSFASAHTIEFSCYDGGHGAFGPSGLDGRLEIVVEGVTNVADARVSVAGAARLGGGDALEPTSPMDIVVEFSTFSGREVVSGTIAGHDAAAL